MWSRAYIPSFERHRHNVKINGFLARRLDADDFAFLEQVRKRGSANSTLPGADTVLIEELEFWHLPYTLDRSAIRRVGPEPVRNFATPESRAIKQVRSNLWHARRTVAAYERSIADVEMQREQAEREQARAVRRTREMLADVDLSAGKRSFGKVVNRHYVPQWKLDEHRAVLLVKRREAVSLRMEQNREQVDEVKQFKLRRIAKMQKTLDLTEAKVVAAYAMLEQAENANNRIKQGERIFGPEDMDTLKQTVLDLVRDTRPYVWSTDTLMRCTGCFDAQMLQVCLYELVRDGKLGAAGPVDVKEPT